MGIRTPFIFTLLVSSLTVFGQTSINVQDKDAAYIKTITSRSEKIVATLGISDPSKANQITTIIAGK